MKPEPQDLRFGHDLSQIQDENGVDLALLRANRALPVEQRLLALEEMIRFAESVRRVERAAPTSADVITSRTRRQAASTRSARSVVTPTSSTKT